jgi:hypothetical protein
VLTKQRNTSLFRRINMSEKGSINREEKLSGEKIAIRHPIFLWFENVWYHYKWTIIVVAFFLFVAIVCFAQCATTPHKDIYVTFAGSHTMVGEEQSAIERVFAELSKKAFEGDAPAVGITSYPFYTEGELRALYTDPETGDFDGAAFNMAKGQNTNRLKELSTYMGTGECSIWLVNTSVYEAQHMSEKLAVPLTDTFGTKPAGAYDDYAIRLGDTAIYQYYEALQVLPADTLIVFTRGYFMGASSNKETYEQFKTLYKAIIEFQAP